MLYWMYMHRVTSGPLSSPLGQWLPIRGQTWARQKVASTTVRNEGKPAKTRQHGLVG